MKRIPGYRKIPVLFFCSAFLVVLAQEPALCKSRLNNYVQKYNNIEISQKGVERVGQFDELVHYFCSFDFFRPRYKVSPDFLKALILAESSADPRALSPKNARGLTQILPETGKTAARELYDRKIDFKHVTEARLKNLQPDDLYDPAINILLASYLIAKYNYQYNGKLQLVVAAWNAGTNSISDNEPPDYRETLELIGKINGYLLFLMNRNKTYGPEVATKR